VSASVQWVHATSADELNAAVLRDVSAVITDAVRLRGNAVVAFPGGNTPLPILAALAEAPLPWSQVTVLPSDDRLVPLSSPLSNVAMLTRLFAPLGARVMAFGEDGADYRRSGREADAALQQLSWPLDLVWLGMGGDGHTASIFVGPDLETALQPALGVRAVGVRPDPLPPEAPVNRVTLTAPAIAAARRTILLISGVQKQQLLERALAEGAASAFPIGRVLAHTSGAVVYSLGG
jgi:6-phosphogluconolactonase